MQYSIVAKFINETATKPRRYKFTDTFQGDSVTVCVDGDPWCEAEKKTDGKLINILAVLADQLVLSEKQKQVNTLHGAVLDLSKNIYVFVPVQKLIKNSACYSD
ncbi:hypothetical protein COPG_00148 [Colwellia phage 9A]|uniref:Uncharacterized protein n=1 Tax=Colwellia phage 9A TaxID=765765 RepID=I3UMM9_9CAUD|nr:hypothetical protein COPG_00148 [Colwellia phage 9A]AFK66744.1 hypothetical protein COPG_00148 [Colwellia phage 9A]